MRVFLCGLLFFALLVAPPLAKADSRNPETRCQRIQVDANAEPEVLVDLDVSPVQIASTGNGRLFLNYSRWFGPLQESVVEVEHSTKTLPYPSIGFSGGSGLPNETAVSVQSVYIDPNKESLWIVDSGNPQLRGILPGAPKIVEVNLATNQIVRTLLLDGDAAPAGSYLADIRIDRRRNVAFLPDNALGAITIVDLNTGVSRRVLEGHMSTTAADIDILVDGSAWRMPDGRRPKIGATSIAIDPESKYLYFKPLIGRTLYRAEIEALLEGSEVAEAAVHAVAQTNASDAMAFGPDGALYLTDVELGGVARWHDGDKRATQFVEDQRLGWPVGITWGPRGDLYVTAGNIHRGHERGVRYPVLVWRWAEDFKCINNSVVQPKPT